MRHQPALKHEPRTPAAWPRPVPVPVGLVVEEDAESAKIIALPIAPEAEPEIATPCSAAPDLPIAVGRLIVLSYFSLIGVFFAFMAKSPLAAFMITISGLFVLIFMTVPVIFLRTENDPTTRPGFSQFMYEGIDTLTGRVKGRDVLVQMLIVPVFLTVGLAVMGIAGLYYIG